MDHEDSPTGAKPDNRTGDGGTEQVEDYLRLEEHIQQLQADRRPRRPRRLSPDQARVYQTAALFRAAAPGAAEPSPEFVAQLRSRLEAQVETQSKRVLPRPHGLSRRGLLTGGLSAAAAAAGVAVGVGVDRIAQQSRQSDWPTTLVPNGSWVPVVSAAALPVGAVQRFATESLVGFIHHTTAGFEALSGACTHMGCLLSWNGAARTFDCPCHGGRFLDSGLPAPSSPVTYRPLPRIQTQVRDGKVWVYVPVSADPAPAGTNASGPYQG